MTADDHPTDKVNTKSFAEILKAAILAGLIAGLMAATFHWVFTEPLIDRAVELEARSHEGAAHEEPVVGRPAQKFGLFVGFLLYGVAWAVLLGLLVYAARPVFAELNYGKQGFLFALILGWSAAIFPLLKYPANPPGVGEAETIGYRQEIFLSFIALSVLGVVLTFALDRFLRPRKLYTLAMTLNFYAMYIFLIFIALPENPDPVKLPLDLVQWFRLLSIFGQIVFWLSFGGFFWWYCRTRD